MSPGRRRAALGPPAAPEPSVLGARFWRAVRLPVPRREGGPAQRLDLGGRRAAMASPPLAAAAAVGSGGEASSGSEETGTEPPGRDLAALFEQAAERLPSLLPTASKEQLLYLYARYKQVRRDRGGPARPDPRPESGRPAPVCGPVVGPRTKERDGDRPGTRVAGPGALPAEGLRGYHTKCDDAKWEKLRRGGVGEGAAGSFLASTKFGTARFTCGKGRRSLGGRESCQIHHARCPSSPLPLAQCGQPQRRTARLCCGDVALAAAGCVGERRQVSVWRIWPL